MTAPGTGRFPPDIACGWCADRRSLGEEPCLGRDHETLWDEAAGDFKGSRCERHGGHKFRPLLETEARLVELRERFIFDWGEGQGYSHVFTEELDIIIAEARALLPIDPR